MARPSIAKAQREARGGRRRRCAGPVVLFALAALAPSCAAPRPAPPEPGIRVVSGELSVSAEGFGESAEGALEDARRRALEQAAAVRVAEVESFTRAAGRSSSEAGEAYRFETETRIVSRALLSGMRLGPSEVERREGGGQRALAEFFVAREQLYPAETAEELARGAPDRRRADLLAFVRRAEARGDLDATVIGYRSLADLDGSPDDVLALALEEERAGQAGAALATLRGRIAKTAPPDRRLLDALEALVGRAAPGSAEAWLALGETLERAGEVGRAIEAYRRAARAAGEGPRAGVALASLARLSAARAAAEAEAARALEPALRRACAGRAAAPVRALAVLEAEGPAGATGGEGGGERRERFAGRVGEAAAALGIAGLEVRGPAECRNRLAAAGLPLARHGDFYSSERRPALSGALEADLALLIVLGQRASARLFDLGTGESLAHAAVFDPPGAAFGDEGGGAGEPIEAEVELLGQRFLGGGRVENVLVTDGAVLRSGDQVEVRVRPRENAYVYVIWFDSAGKAWVLFPGTERLFPAAGRAPPNPIRAGEWLAVPAAGLYFSLDERRGPETIYVIAAREPLPDLEGLAKALESEGAGAAGRGGSDHRAALRRRLAALAAEAEVVGESAGEGAGLVLRGRSILAREVWFRHE